MYYYCTINTDTIETIGRKRMEQWPSLIGKVNDSLAVSGVFD